MTLAAAGEQMPRVSSSWLALREDADAAARSPELVEFVWATLPARRPLVIHDLGCGTGSMARWLAPRLPGPQHWVLHDRDERLLGEAAASIADLVAVPVTVQTRLGDLADLTAGDLSGAGLVTSSAVLDLLDAAEVEQIAQACAGAGCPALLTLSVTGAVQLTPADPLDEQIAAAFNEHQRRRVGQRRLLGPDAVAVAAQALRSQGLRVCSRPSPWHLGAGREELTRQWLAGWLAAATEQRPELAAPVASYTACRLAQLAAGELRVLVQHDDLLAYRQ